MDKIWTQKPNKGWHFKVTRYPLSKLRGKSMPIKTSMAISELKYMLYWITKHTELHEKDLPFCPFCNF